MRVKSIYRPTPTGGRELLQPNSAGHYMLVDLRIPYFSDGCRTNLRNRASLAVQAHSLDEAALLIGLGYAARAKVSNGKVNYLGPDDLVIERA